MKCQSDQINRTGTVVAISNKYVFLSQAGESFSPIPLFLEDV